MRKKVENNQKKGEKKKMQNVMRVKIKTLSPLGNKYDLNSPYLYGRNLGEKYH